MISHLLLIFGVAILSAALRSFHHPVLFRLGTVCVALTSFLAGWLLGGEIWMGVAFAASWLFLPWVEILTRVRKLRMPMERTLDHRTPPSRQLFPGFPELTDEIEEKGFEYLDDTGWDHEDNHHFYRVFGDAERRTQATICLAEQSEFAFYYISITSRTGDGRVFMTWNYPFSYGLKLVPKLKLNRLSGLKSFAEMLEAHQQFLQAKGVKTSELSVQTNEQVVQTMQSDMHAQIAHNLDIGLLKRADGRFIRYTVRGMLFLWFQFLRDLVRLS